MSAEEITQALTDRVNSDGAIDYIQLTEQLQGIQTITSLILGVLSTIILIMVPIIVCAEVVYIVFPFVQEKLNPVLSSGTGVPCTVLGMTLRDAKIAVERANTKETGRSALWYYFVNKIKSIYFVMFVIAIIVGGSGLVVDILYSLLSGLLDPIIRAIS